MTLSSLPIDFKQRKYIFPLILLVPLIALGYFVCEAFKFEKLEPESELKTTEYLNADLPQAAIRGDGIGGRSESMNSTYSNIRDYTAIENVTGINTDDREAYSQQYDENERQLLEDLAQKQRELSSARGGDPASTANLDSLNRVHQDQRQQDAIAQLNEALAELQSGTVHTTDTLSADLEASLIASTDPRSTRPRRLTPEERAAQRKAEREAKQREANTVHEIAEDAAAEDVTKVMNTPSSYFNTIGSNEPEHKMIQAIIDEDIKAVDGSRVRLRLLDDISISGQVVPKGTYLYANMSGFGQQRVKGTVQSLIIAGQLFKINLRIYDTDGLEGLYVPKSNFREAAQNAAGSALQGSMSMNTSSSSSFEQYGMTALQHTLTRIQNAVSTNVRKNKVELKYGTQVYLVNGNNEQAQESRNSRRRQSNN